jgi:hypothetical protein
MRLHQPSGRRPVRALILAAVLATACGQRPDFELHGVGIVVASQTPFVTHPDLPGRLESTIEAALGYWGGSWTDLRQVTITLEDSRYVECAGHASATGCFDGRDLRVSTLDLGTPFACVEQTVLVHEIGHAVIGDPSHLDPRWMDFAPVVSSLDGRTGYATEGEVACPIFVSVWRHLLGQP